jgi:hypothetical protein
MPERMSGDLGAFSRVRTRLAGHGRCSLISTVHSGPDKEGIVHRITTALAAIVFTGAISAWQVPALAQDGRQRDRQYDQNNDQQNGAQQRPRPEWRRYDYNRPEPGQQRYDAARYYYRDDARYRPRRLRQNERVYRGTDGRFYCRRSDGTTGLIAGGIAGGALGNLLAPGDAKTLGTILGAAGGAIVGSSVDRNNVTCR